MSKTKKIISVVLAVALVMAMAAVAMVSASASTKVYFEDSYGWGNIYAYCYGGDGELFGTWPGTNCTDEGNGVWSIEMTGTPEAVIFNNNAGSQTSNIIYEGTGKIAKLTGNQVQGDYQMVDEAVWEDYADAPVETTTVAPTTEAPTTAAPTTVAPTTTTVVEPTEAPTTTTVVEPTEAPTTVATEDEPTTPATDDQPVVDPTEAPTTVAPTTVAPTTEAPTTVAPTTVAPTTEAPAVKDVIVVGGVEYTAQVGDIITYTATLTTPKNIENVQAVTTFDATKLALVDATAAERFPNMTGVVANAADGVIYFNASEISTGFDFTAGQTLITLQFEVLDASYSEITTTIEEMVEFFGGDYVTGGEIVADGVALVETLNVPEPITTTTDAETEATTTVVVPGTTDVQSTTDAPDEDKDVVPTGVAATLYVVLAVLAMAAAAVVVLRKKVNG